MTTVVSTPQTLSCISNHENGRHITSTHSPSEDDPHDPGGQHAHDGATGPHAHRAGQENATAVCEKNKKGVQKDISDNTTRTPARGAALNVGIEQ